VVVPRLAKSSIVKLAEGIDLNPAASPMIHSISQPFAAAASHDDLLALAALLTVECRRPCGPESTSTVTPF